MEDAMLRYHSLPLEPRFEEPNEATYTAIEAAIREKDMCGPFDSVSDLMEALNDDSGQETRKNGG